MSAQAVKQRNRPRLAARVAEGDRLTVRQAVAAQLLDVSPALLRALHARGEGPTMIKVGRTRLYRIRDLERWLDAMAATS
jgi:hypothetical protein